MEFLCETLCYRLDLASFVACVNSGQSWDITSSLFFSGTGQVEFENGNAYLDPFVENFVLERLSSQSPLRVSFVMYKSVYLRCPDIVLRAIFILAFGKVQKL